MAQTPPINLYIGLDIGSTTIKTIVLDGKGEVIYQSYRRHNARIRELTLELLQDLATKFGTDSRAQLTLTGSIGMGVAERYKLDFIQEVVAATRYMQNVHPEVKTMIDIGGEDSKVVFFRDGQSPDLRMNGNCAGGTGSFIDQMAILLDTDNNQLSDWALKAGRIYQIASRCGVFCKTDIQNLIAKNASREDIAASIFHAVAMQVVSALSHGCDMIPPVLLCGGPLTFLPALRKAFRNVLQLDESAFVVPEQSQLIPSWGAAIQSSHTSDPATTLSDLIGLISQSDNTRYTGSPALKPLFTDAKALASWQADKLSHRIVTMPLPAGPLRALLGIDSGSTTTKIVLLDEQHRLLFSYYSPNRGNPIAAVHTGLEQLLEQCRKAGTELSVIGSCSTGYGEDLIRAAFGLDGGIIETIAHYLAARYIKDDVSFILDIGGQDMKAIFLSGGVINHIEINEACSSGCGTFIETFAKSMGYSVKDFAAEACKSQLPSDLGTRCTVFMNSKVKQVLREGAQVGDIAAGLSYSVIKNCLHKVLKLKSLDELGDHIVVQGGTMRNDAVCRAFELLIGKTVFRSDRPELMGAFGAALYAERQQRTEGQQLEDMMANAQYETRELQCHGCENQCLVNRYRFKTGNTFYSGNKCERIFSNKGNYGAKGANLYETKTHLLFDRTEDAPDKPLLTLGIPRVLNMYEEYPFWHTLFTQCGIKVVLSETSNWKQYERGLKSVMSDNICFPAKLVHSHILALQDQQVDRIFLPYVVFEQMGKGSNSFNCPIVSGYSDVVRNSMQLTVPLDSPVITFKDKRVLLNQCQEYLKSLGVKKKAIKPAFDKALESFAQYEQDIARANREAYAKSQAQGRLTILLAGRPYHTDPLIQHKISDMIAALGVDVITDDITRGQDIDISDMHFVSQWSYPEHIEKAAKWAAEQDPNVQFVEMTSFGCGPDSFMLDEIHAMLKRYGKALTQLKIDDVSNIGSLKLRVRSVVDSIRIKVNDQRQTLHALPFVTTPIYTMEERLKHSKIIVPYFTEFIVPLIPSFMKLAGYDVDVLPLSDELSGDHGLTYANNEICYPATLIVGDIIKAFKSGRYDPATTAVAMTQTGGQCRATNYIPIIKKALVDAGFDNVPVISLSFSSDVHNVQPGFRFDWKKLTNIAFSTMLYSDTIAKLYYSSAPREKEPGLAMKLREKYLDLAKSPIERNQSHELINYLTGAAHDFDRICVDKKCPRVGIVGEIFLKFNPYAQRQLTHWLLNNGIEIEPPLLTQFFLQSFVNQDVKQRTGIAASRMPRLVRRTLHYLVSRRIKRINSICSAFRYYHPLEDIYDIARNASDIVSLNAQFGEGWLLPGEVATMARSGITHVVSLQPFGCIANHIISKGIERRLRQLYPNLSFLSLDFDSGVSDVNVTNRILLFANDILD